MRAEYETTSYVVRPRGSEALEAITTQGRVGSMNRGAQELWINEVTLATGTGRQERG